MKTSNPFCFAAWKMRSMFSMVLFSLTLPPTNPHARPFSLKTSFCGSMKTIAVSLRSNATGCRTSIRGGTFGLSVGSCVGSADECQAHRPAHLQETTAGHVVWFVDVHGFLPSEYGRG